MIEELEKNIKSEYNIRLNEIIKNTESTVGNVYMLNCDNNKYVAKVYNNIKHVKSMIKLHEELNKNQIYAPEIIKNNDGIGYTKINSENYYVVLYSFLEGHQVTWDKTKIKLTDNEIIVLANSLRKLHELNNNSEIKLPKIPFGNYKKRKGILHFDLTKQNIFINQDKIGFIDFDDAKFGESICDVSILIANLFFSKTRGANLDGMNKFIDAYYAEDLQIKQEETRLIKQYAIDWINYVLAGNEFSASITESFHVKRKLIEEYL